MTIPEQVDPSAFYNALNAADIEYAGFSCNGVNLFGNAKDIDQLKRWHHDAGTVAWLKSEIVRLTALVGVQRPEDVARAIYDVMPYDGQGTKPPWIPNGNSLKQDEARRYANAGLGVMGQRPDRETVALKVQNILAETLDAEGGAEITGTGKASYQIADAVLALPHTGQSQEGRDAYIIELCAKVAEGYPEQFGEEYVAHGLIGSGQDTAARDIAERIRALSAAPAPPAIVAEEQTGAK